MQSQSIEKTLQNIKRGITEPCSYTEQLTVDAINEFQNDPSILKPYLKQFISAINKSFVDAIDNNTMKNMPLALFRIQGEYFYNLAKICSTKITNKYLSTDISYLDPILKLLPEIKRDSGIQFFLLSWCQIIIQAPFNLTNDSEIWQLTNSYKKNQMLSPVVADIHSFLYQKNYTLFCQHVDEIDLLTLNKFLKTQLVESTSNILKDTTSLNKITQLCLHPNEELYERSQLITLKILPKLFLLHSWKENWDILSDIMEWYDLHIDSSYTEVRFILAHSYAKILNRMINDLNGETQAIQCIEELINNLLHMINNTPMDIIDRNTFHTHLLLVAECSKIIVKYLPHWLIVITNEILPLAYKFQQLHMGNAIKGSQIKDAANFIIWSWSRCPRLPNTVVCDLIKFLLVTTLFDRDFLIRKSSNAALQELLGRHGKSVLGNMTTMNIIQLPIHNIHVSFQTNLINVYKICQEENSQQGNDIYDYMVRWLFEQNVMINFDLDIVLLSANALAQFHNDTPTYPLLNIIKQYLAESTITKSLTCSRMLYLLTESSKDDIETFSTELQSLSVTIETTKFGPSVGKNEYFQYLTLLHYWNVCLMHNSFTFTTDRVTLFYKIMSGINEQNPWFDQFNTISHELFDKLGHIEPTKGFWTLFEKALKSNKPLVCSSLPMLSQHNFLNYFCRYNSTFTCQSKALIISTLANYEDAFMKLRQHEHYMDIISVWLNDYTITKQGDVGRLTREAACELIAKRYSCLTERDIKVILYSNLLYLAAEPARKVRQLSINILTDTLSEYLPETYNYKGTSHNIKLFELQLALNDDVTSRSFWKRYFSYAGAFSGTEDEIMTANNDFVGWFVDLNKDLQKRTLDNIIIAIPSYQDIRLNPAELKYACYGLKFLERLWISRCGCGYMGFNWDGVFAKIYNLSLLKSKRLLGTILLVIPALAIAWKEFYEGFGNFFFLNKLIEFLVKLFNTNGEDDILNSKLTPVQMRCIQALVDIFFELENINKITYLEDFSRSYQPNSLLSFKQLLL